jgi:hypothetical protein
MKTDKNQIRDSVSAVMSRGREITSKNIFGGNVEVVLRGADGNVKYSEKGDNLVTDYGDDMLATRTILDAVEIVTGMKLGTGVTAAAKAGAGGAMVTYITGSNEDLDAVAGEATKGAGLGWRTTYVCTWIAGDVTNGAIAEVVLTNETPLTDVTSVLGDTVARFVFGATIDKQAGDSLEVTWNIDFLGA